MEHIKDCDADFAFLSETWLTSITSDVTAVVKSYGYKIQHYIRKDSIKKSGGGVAILYLTKYKLKKFITPSYSSFEHIAYSLSVPGTDKIVMISLYRLQHVSTNDFFKDFVELLEILSTENCMLIIAGDINIHMDIGSDQHTNEFTQILESFDLHQLVSGPTQKLGHQLEVIITNDVEKFLNPVVDDVCLSDHFRINCLFNNGKKVLSKYKTIQFREIKSMDHVAFSDLVKSKLELCNISNSASFDTSISSYNTILKSALDLYAPLKEKIIKDVVKAPWFDEEYRNLRKLRRNAEKLWRKTKLEVHKLEFQRLRRETTTLASAKKRDNCRAKIDEAGGNQKALYSVLQSITGQNETPCYPAGMSDHENANKFAEFFLAKVNSIRQDFQSRQHSHNFTSIPNDLYLPFENQHEYLDVFEPSTDSEIREIINKHGFTCSFTDPVPATILNKHIDLFIPIWTSLVNLSLSTGSIDGILKQADITPLLKGFGLNFDERKNFRPVSNLQFLEKLIERVVSERLKSHMAKNNLENDNQYGYKKGHSTETILVKITNDILIASDKKTATVLLLLDLSAAFDTVDINCLIKILFHEIGIRGTALQWFCSFLRQRTMRVKVNGSFSEVFELEFGVPQGSVLGPLLFNIYIRSIYKHIHSTGFTIKGFADDHQLYVSFSPDFQYAFLGDRIRLVMNQIDNWMNCFFLKLNQNKTQVIVFGPESVRNKISINGVFVENNKTCIRFRNIVKNLGIFLDASLSFSDQIKSVVSTAFASIKSIARIKSFLTVKEKCTLLTALVLSKVDYCNLLYYGINNSLLNRLQVVQNSAARLVFNKRKFDHSSGLLFELHWLPVKERINYKINLIIHKALYHTSSNDIQNLVTITSTRTFNLKGDYRSNSVYGDRAFVVYAPQVWNQLPLYLKTETSLDTFKKNLKTFLFRSAFINSGYIH